jgi:RNase P subunit RPR2
MMMTAMKDKLVADGLYDPETCDVMSDAEAETLGRLHQEIDAASKPPAMRMRLPSDWKNRICRTSRWPTLPMADIRRRRRHRRH